MGKVAGVRVSSSCSGGRNANKQELVVARGTAQHVAVALWNGIDLLEDPYSMSKSWGGYFDRADAARDQDPARGRFRKVFQSCSTHNEFGGRVAFKRVTAISRGSVARSSKRAGASSSQASRPT